MFSHFLNPAAFWWALVIPLIVLLYFLKLKREEYIFPSTLLWQRTLQDLRVNSPFQRLKNNLLLLLQILLFFLLVLALARPFLIRRNTTGKNLVVLFDNSASMQAEDENGQSRLQKARQMCLEMIEDLSQGDRMMIISFAGEAIIYQPFTGLKTLLRQAVQKIPATDNRTKLREALTIAEAMAQKVSSPSLYIISDGAIPDLPEVLENFKNSAANIKKKKKNIALLPNFLIVGKYSDNVAILALEVRAAQDGNYQAFTRIQNFGTKAVQGFLQLTINGVPIEEDVRMVELGPGDVNGILFENIEVSQGIIEAKLTITSGKDYLAVDNKAYFAIAPTRKPKIALISTGNYFLRKALLPHDANLVIYSPAKFEELRQKDVMALKKFDLLIFDNWAPSKVFSGGVFLFINALPHLRDLRVLGEIKSKVGMEIIDQNDFHALMRFVNMRRLTLAQMLKVDWPEDIYSLVEAENHIAIATLYRQHSHYLFIAFDLFQSDWLLRLSFPIFMANTIQWAITNQGMCNIESGEIFRLRPPEKVTSAKLYLANGKQQTLQMPKNGDLIITNTAKVGFYKLVFDNKQSRDLSVNLFSSEESDITPQLQIKIGKKSVSSRRLRPINKELWQIFTLLAFFILLLEWYLYHRRSLNFWRNKSINIKDLEK